MTTTEPLCPKCAGPMWNNIATKKNPKSPDFKCKNDGKNGRPLCDGVIWPPRTGASPYAAPAATPASNAKQAFSSGGPLPWEQPVAPIQEPVYGDEAAHHAAIAALTPAAKLDKLFAVYGVIESHVLATSVKKFEAAGIGASPESIAAQIATLFIQASQRGLAA